MTNIIRLADFRKPLRSDQFRITSYSKAEKLGQHAIRKVATVRRSAQLPPALPAAQVLEIYQNGIIERNAK
jgi:hypothetical protein